MVRFVLGFFIGILLSLAYFVIEYAKAESRGKTQPFTLNPDESDLAELEFSDPTGRSYRFRGHLTPEWETGKIWVHPALSHESSS